MESIILLTVLSLIIIFALASYARMKEQIAQLKTDLKVAKIHCETNRKLYDIRTKECEQLYEECNKLINRAYNFGNQTTLTEEQTKELLDQAEGKADEILSLTKAYIDQTNEYIKKVSESLK